MVKRNELLLEEKNLCEKTFQKMEKIVKKFKADRRINEHLYHE